VLVDIVPRAALALGTDLPDLATIVEIVDATPTFVLRAEGDVASVRAMLKASYAEVELDVPPTELPPPLAILPGITAGADGVVRPRVVRRDIGAERMAADLLFELGLGLPDGHANWFEAHGDKAVQFWTEGVGSLPDTWDRFIPDDLVDVHVREARPSRRTRGCRRASTGSPSTWSSRARAARSTRKTCAAPCSKGVGSCASKTAATRPCLGSRSRRCSSGWPSSSRRGGDSSRSRRQVACKTSCASCRARASSRRRKTSSPPWPTMGGWAPTSVVTNWLREIQRFAPSLKAVAWTGPDREKRLHELDTADVLITSYALLRRDEEFLAASSSTYAILDEAQHIKNPLSATAARRSAAAPAAPRAHGHAHREPPLGDLVDLRLRLAGPARPLDKFEERFARPIDRATTRRAAAAREVDPPAHPAPHEAGGRQGPPREDRDGSAICDLSGRAARDLPAGLREVRAQVLGEVERVGLAKSQIRSSRGSRGCARRRATRASSAAARVHRRGLGQARGAARALSEAIEGGPQGRSSSRSS
jgi:hypothetical protein